MEDAIEVREVWGINAGVEISLIQDCLQEFPYISMDTEFPGTIFTPTTPSSAAADLYATVKRNVDALCLIQLGLTLSDAAGNLPVYDGRRCVWEFNFSDFDSVSDPHNPDSISLLQRQGIDFSKNRRMGVDSRTFALLFKLSGLSLRSIRRRNLTWITFHGVYDLAFLIKVLTGRRLPDALTDFMALLRVYFGPNVYDLKPVARALGLHGGLEKIAKSLAVGRAVGKSHQAGSDSLLTMQVFVALLNKFGPTKTMLGFNYKVFGLNS